MKDNLQKAFEPVTGFILAAASWDMLSNILVSTLIAFLGGIAAWMAKKLCEYFYKKIFK